MVLGRIHNLYKYNGKTTIPFDTDTPNLYIHLYAANRTCILPKCKIGTCEIYENLQCISAALRTSCRGCGSAVLAKLDESEKIVRLEHERDAAFSMAQPTNEAQQHSQHIQQHARRSTTYPLRQCWGIFRCPSCRDRPHHARIQYQRRPQER